MMFQVGDGCSMDYVRAGIIVSPIVYSRLRVYILRADQRVCRTAAGCIACRSDARRPTPDARRRRRRRRRATGLHRLNPESKDIP
ncbi:hypothetical protein DIE06_30430 [Burkholderia sp. Bp8998]|nr:hypothetical protein DIE06_30430 [Burkholderia sp. Bp8998]